jgi:DNA polymerase elongation subunit (family B)
MVHQVYLWLTFGSSWCTRDIVRDCLTSILHTGSAEDAAALVRQKLVELMDDTLPLESYAIQKTLRKSMQDVCHPMFPDEVAQVREKLHAAGSHAESRGGQQLTYAEQDDAIRLKIPLRWRLRIRLPHVMLSYRMREADVGSAPVSGDIIRYIVTNNGRGNKVWEKAETLDDVRGKGIAVDRKYYLKSLYTPLINLFLPIVRQRREDKVDEKNAVAETDRLLFDITKHRPWRQDEALRRACMANSPLVMAFARQRASADDEPASKRRK